jgi:hypothetical protein
MFQVGRKWQPYRTASRYVPLESTQNQDSWSLIGPSFKWLSILGPRATFEASLQRGGYWWPDVPWTTDVRKQDITTTATRGAFLETDRTPRRWQYGGTLTYFAELWGRSHELETDTWVGTTFSRPRISGIRISSSTVTAGVTGDPNCDEASNYDGCFRRADSVLVYDYPNTTASGEWYNSAYVNGRITYVPIAANLTSVSGGSTNRRIDPDLNGPFVDEYTAGIDIGLSRVLTVQFNYVKKLDGSGNKRINEALPYDAYTISATGIDPGRDNVTGTADDRPLTIHSVPRTLPTFGQVIERITQLGDDEGRNKYDAYGVTLNKQFSNGWSFLASFNAATAT